MFVLFVPGLGMPTLSGWPLLRSLRRAGHATGTFGYWVYLESAEKVVARLRTRLLELGAEGEYAVLGHSLGGVLLRAAIQSLPEGSVPPRRVVLIGSPLVPPSLTKRFRTNPLWRMLAGDCGQLVLSDDRMALIGPLTAPTTAVVGIRGWSGPWSPFGGEANDSNLAFSEVTAPWLTDVAEVTTLHTFMPLSGSVARIVVQKLAMADAQTTLTAPASRAVNRS